MSDRHAAATTGYLDEEVASLQRALSFAGVDGNPDVRDQGWAAYRAVTADNLEITGWKLDLDEGWFSTRRGMLVAKQALGLQLDDETSSIPVPIEVHHPEPIDLDHELASAILDYLTPKHGSDGDERQRAAVAIDWLTLAWRNTTSVAVAPRLIFLRTALEAMFPGKSRQTAKALPKHFERFAAHAEVVLDRRLDELLWSPTDVPTHPARDQSGRLNTDLQDWFWTFASTRNHIVHQGETDPGVYEGPATAYRGELFWTAERLVREIIRTQLAIAGYGDVWMRPESRRVHRAAAAALDELEARNIDRTVPTTDRLQIDG